MMPTGYIFKNVYYVYQEVTAGITYLHQNGMVHGDIKGMYVLSYVHVIAIMSWQSPFGSFFKSTMGKFAHKGFQDFPPTKKKVSISVCFPSCIQLPTFSYPNLRLAIAKVHYCAPVSTGCSSATSTMWATTTPAATLLETRLLFCTLGRCSIDHPRYI